MGMDGVEERVEAEKRLFMALNFPNHTKKMREFGVILTIFLAAGVPRKALLFLYIKIQDSRFKACCTLKI